MDEDMSIEDEDEVVYETDVYLSKSLSESLYLFHYPTRNGSVSFEDLECLSAKIKPKQQKLEMELGIDVHSNYYDRSRGEQMAYNVDGQNNSGEQYFQNSHMDKYLVTGTKAYSSTESYALGFMRKGELHVTPLQSVMELKPGFIHMDKIDSASKKALNPDEDEAVEEEAVAVTVRFEGPNAEKDRQIRQKSYQFLQQKNASEPWIHVNYHKLGSNRSYSETEKLLCSQMYNNVTNDCISPQDYLKSLLPDIQHLAGYIEVEEESAILSHKTVSDQIKHLLISAHLMTFAMILEKLSLDISKKVEILQRVQQFAVLVQGCWAVKSELLYNEDSVSPHSGMCSKSLVNARDYVLWLFTKSKFLTRKEILSAIYVPDADFKDMIIPMAIKTNRGWEFKFPCDKEFVENHPAVEQSQEMKWNLRYKKLVNDLGVSEFEGDSKTSHTPPQRPRQKRHSRSSISEGDESGNDSTKDPQNKRSYVVKKRPPPLSPTKPNAKSKSFQIATLDVSPTFLETSPPESVKAELKSLVGDALRAQFCMTLTEIKEVVLDSALRSIVNRSDFEKLLDEVLVDYGAQKLKNKWPSKSSSETTTPPDTLYAFAKFGNKLDRYRTALLELFSTTARARTNLFVKKVEDELRELVPESDVRQILEEYCVWKSGFFYLKGTIALEP